MKTYVHRFVMFLALAAFTGCQTTAYDAEIQEAVGEVQRRTGWKPEWSAPWADQLPAWDGKAPLSLAKAATAALQSNRQIRADVEMIGVARADYVQAGLLPNPVLSVVFGFPSGGGSPMVTAGIGQEVAALWLLPSRVEAASADLRQAVLRVSSNALELVSQVQQSHRRIGYQQIALRLLSENEKVLKQAQTLAMSKLRAGTGTQLDVNRIRADQLANQSETIATQLELDNEKRRLLELMGMADRGTEWTAEETPVEADGALVESQVIELARQQRLDVLAAEWSIKARTQRLREENLGVLPELELGAELERNPDESPKHRAGPDLSIELPIFDQNQARIAAARAELRKSIAEHGAVQQQAIREVRQAFVSYAQAAKLVAFYREQVIPLHESNLRLAEAGFTAGEQDLTALLDVQRELIDARLKLAGFERDHGVAEADLSRAAGGALLMRKK
jgi:cobalt-zinc-cadmium efflux system outer membrane protein